MYWNGSSIGKQTKFPVPLLPSKIFGFHGIGRTFQGDTWRKEDGKEKKGGVIVKMADKSIFETVQRYMDAGATFKQAIEKTEGILRMPIGEWMKDKIREEVKQ